MTSSLPIEPLRRALERFTGQEDGTPDHLVWHEISRRRSGLLPSTVAALRRNLEPREIVRDLDACWSALTSPSLKRLISQYHVDPPELGLRLASNARRLLAAATVAWAARALSAGDIDAHDPLGRWLERLMPGAGTPGALGAPAERIVREALTGTGSSGGEAAGELALALWCLDENLPRVRRMVRVPVVGVSKGAGGELDYVRLDLLDFPAGRLVEHADTMLEPADEMWLAGLERAWRDAGGPGTIRITFGTRSEGRVIEGDSASGAIAVGIRCLRDEMPYDASRLILAAVGTVEGTVVGVGKVTDKLEATDRSGEIRHVAIGSGDPNDGLAAKLTDSKQAPEIALFLDRRPHSTLSLRLVTDLDAAFEFVTVEAAAIARFLETVLKAPFGLPVQIAPEIDPYLVMTDSEAGDQSSGQAPGPESPSRGRNRVPFKALIDTLLEAGSAPLLVTAPPGYGKTVLARRLSRELARGALDASDSGQAPLVLPLNVSLLLEAAIAAEDASPDECARRSLREATAMTYSESKAVAGLLAERASSERTGPQVVIVLDAIDALAPDQLAYVAPVLEAILAWPCRVVVVARSFPDILPRWGTLRFEIEPFSTAQILSYLHGRFVAEPLAHRRLLDAIRMRPRLARSASVPQMLAWLCDVFEMSPDVSTRSAILLRVTERLAQRGPSSSERGPDVVRLLRSVAGRWWHERDGARAVARSTLCDWVADEMEDRLPTAATMESRLEYGDRWVADRWVAQLLFMKIIVALTVEEDLVTWYHDSILEGLAALYIATRGQSADAWEPSPTSRSWRVLIPLIAGYHPAPAQVFEGLLRRPDPFHRKLFLAAECLAECDRRTHDRDAALLARSRDIILRLIELLESTATRDRERAVEALSWCVDWIDTEARGRIGDVFAHCALPEGRAAAAEALVAVGVGPVTDAILNFVRDSANAERWRVVRRFGTNADDGLIAVLMELVDDASPELQTAAVEAIAAMGSASAVDTLFELLGSRSPWSRNAAAAAIAGLSYETESRLWITARTAKSPVARAAAVVALGGCGLLWSTSPDSESLGQLSRDSSAEVRVAVAEALAAAPPQAALRPLVAMLSDRNPKVRVYALSALARTGARDAAPHVELLLDDADELVRVRAAATLIRFGQYRHEAYLLQLATAGPAGRVAMGLLVTSQSPNALAVLEELVREPTAVRVEAAYQLARYGQAADERALLDMLDGARSESERIAAIRALGSVGTGAAVPHLLAFLGEGSRLVRAAAIESLGRIGHESSASALARLAAVGDPVARYGASKALSRLPATREVISTVLAEGSTSSQFGKTSEIYEALCRVVERDEVWDFSDATEPLDTLTWQSRNQHGDRTVAE